MRLSLSILLSLIFLRCAGPVKTSDLSPAPDSKELQQPVKSETPPTASGTQQQTVIDDYSQPVPPPQWIGKKVKVLPKQKLVCAQGYTLSTCRNNRCDTTPLDPSWEHANHRVRCDKISGDSLFVEAVEPDKDEWLITFAHIPTEKRLYARTHKKAISEIAYSDDLEAARRRWMSTCVFSKKGVISVNESASGTAIKSMRINIQDSLLVVDVRWGMTPLPVKPIWLIVKTHDGKQGFIPVRYSWTNTMTDQQTDRLPWEDDIFETNPAFLYDWDENMWELINNHRVIIGMTPDQVSTSWGYPVSVEKTPSSPSQDEIWTYPSQELHFFDNKLTSITERTPSMK